MVSPCGKTDKIADRHEDISFQTLLSDGKMFNEIIIYCHPFVFSKKL